MILKRQTVKMWESINDLGDKYNSFDQDLDKIVMEKIDDEIEIMQSKFNKRLNNTIKAKKDTAEGLNSGQLAILRQLEKSGEDAEHRKEVDKKLKNLQSVGNVEL